MSRSGHPLSSPPLDVNSENTNDDRADDEQDYELLYQLEKEKNARFWEKIESLTKIIEKHEDLSEMADKQKNNYERLITQLKNTIAAMRLSWNSLTSFPESADEKLIDENKRLRVQVQGLREILDYLFKKICPQLIESKQLLIKLGVAYPEFLGAKKTQRLSTRVKSSSSHSKALDIDVGIELKNIIGEVSQINVFIQGIAQSISEITPLQPRSYIISSGSHTMKSVSDNNGDEEYNRRAIAESEHIQQIRKNLLEKNGLNDLIEKLKVHRSNIKSMDRAEKEGMHELIVMLSEELSIMQNIAQNAFCKAENKLNELNLDTTLLDDDVVYAPRSFNSNNDDDDETFSDAPLLSVKI